jgi:glutamine cyclotransferase
MSEPRPPARQNKSRAMSRAVVLFFVFAFVLAAAVYCGLVQPVLQPKTSQECITSPASIPVRLPPSPGTAPIYGYQIVHAYPHDRAAFTQGLVFADDGFLYESTGLYGQSSLRKVELETGEAVRLRRLPADCFAEGLTLWQDQLIQLTWQEHVGFVYEKESFRLLRTFTYPSEGWGITHDGKRLIMSDGTAVLRFLDPVTFQEIDRIEVKDQNSPVSRLNELEYIHGEIYANIWQTDLIAVISPETGEVLRWIDLRGLLSQEDRLQPVDVLNGIAYDAKGDRLFVTGKLWPKLFEIQLVPPNP